MEKLAELVQKKPKLSMQVGYNSAADWCITINEMQNGNYVQIVMVQSCDYHFAVASAYIALCNYLSETRGGY